MLKTLIIPALCLALSTCLLAEEKDQKLSLAGGRLVVQVPADWKKAASRSRILESEFSAPADAKPDEPSARITFMAAGGSIDANIERWFGQFTQPDGKATKDAAKVEEFKVGDAKVHWVEIPGTYMESMGGGPFAPGKKVERKEYRMLASIIVLENGLQYFIKMTGPDELVQKQKEGFLKMVKELEAK